MSAINDRNNAMAFAAEGMAGTAGAAALRQTRSLLDRAPTGRLFGTIATLAEMSGRATSQLEQGNLAAPSAPWTHWRQPRRPPLKCRIFRSISRSAAEPRPGLRQRLTAANCAP